MEPRSIRGQEVLVLSRTRPAAPLTELTSNRTSGGELGQGPILIWSCPVLIQSSSDPV